MMVVKGKVRGASGRLFGFFKDGTSIRLICQIAFGTKCAALPAYLKLAAQLVHYSSMNAGSVIRSYNGPLAGTRE